ncbi:MAG: ferrous iron transport protein B [Candidatus Bathyarchaeota archaeon]|nr:ferrous iron transport protein B [Candidatus Bathyarchaeota archaeon]
MKINPSKSVCSCGNQRNVDPSSKARKENELIVALAGNANVGKSAIFNQLTGLNQVTGNWPGKTVERAEGTLHFKGYTIHVVDLPGTYSLSAYSMEELVSREYLATEKPDIIVNVVDASALERNLYLTLQLLELEVPLVIALNQVDFAAKKGLKIDVEKLSKFLGVKIVPTVAVAGKGITELLSVVVSEATQRRKQTAVNVVYGKELETQIVAVQKLVASKLPQFCVVYPARWVAIKLLEKDSDITEKVRSSPDGSAVLELVERLTAELEKVHGESAPVVVASERYTLASKIVKDTVTVEAKPKISIEQTLSTITTHKILGYLILAAVVVATFGVIFAGGNYLSRLLDECLMWLSDGFEGLLAPILPAFAVDLLVKGVLGGLVSGITIALPYIVPFYVVLALLEDSGYLPRAAFLMDNIMHKIGLHGKAFIPLILGYGCTVPACIGCRIMETQRERLLSAFVVVLIPCAARTVVILGLVGQYVGLSAVVGLYVFDLVLVFALGRIAFKALPGEPVGLIMEMPSYKKPSLKTLVIKTWGRTKDFVYVAFPIIIVGSVIIEAFALSGLMPYFVDIASPIMTAWLGLPAIVAIPLLFGILRKELTLILLATTLSSIGLSLESLSAVQMIVFALVVMIYIPCLATIAACKREFGWKKSLYITIIDVGLALIIGGLAFRILSALMST